MRYLGENSSQCLRLNERMRRAKPMKKNLPVTQTEIPFPLERYLVSKTDLKGVITYANDEFVKISGYSREELVGKSHNVVRHPDMPPQAFAQMWATLKRGQPWNGVVKNRAKNGDYYWVEAFIVPERANGEILGYMSVRSRPSREQVRAAEVVYAQLNQSGAAIPEKRAPWLESYRLRLMMIGGLFALALCAVLTKVLLDLGAIEAGGQAAQDAVRSARVWLLAGGAATLLLFPIMLWFKLSAIMRPMQDVIHCFDRIAEGVLVDKIDIGRGDEFGEIFRSLAVMQTRLRVMLDDIRESVMALQQNSSDLQAQMFMVSMQFQKQQSVVEEVQLTTSQFTHAVTEVADSAKQTASHANESRRLVAACSHSMQQGMAANGRVVVTVNDSGRIIRDLSQSIGKIGAITSSIKEIADQTNLLALNAAIEAARAGEYGRGFAVVADEVRKLAEHTAKSTTEIASRVKEVTLTSGQAVAAMDSAVREVGEAVELMRKGVTELASVTESSEEVSRMSNHIADAADDEARAGVVVTSNMCSVAESVTLNVQIAEQVSHLSKDVLQTATRLKTLLSAFDLFPTSSDGVAPVQAAPSSDFIEL